MATHPAAQRLTQSAWQCFAAGDLAGAVTHARDAVRLDRLSSKACAALGYFLIQTGNTEEAAAVLLPALDRAPDDAVLHWYKGYLLSRGGDTAGAAAAFQRACVLDASLDEAAYALAWALIDLGRIEDAAHWAAQALHRARTPQRFMQAGWIQQLRGEIGQAAHAYREAISGFDAQAPEQLRLHVCLAQCLRHLRRHDEVDALLRKALEQWPGNADLLAETMWLAHARGRTGLALRQARDMVKAQPDNAEAWHRLGAFLQDGGDLKAADEALSKAQERAPGLADAIFRRAQIKRGFKQFEDAKLLLDRVLGQEPENAAAHALMAQVLLDLQETVAACRLLHKRVRVQPQVSELWRLLAAAQLGRGRSSGAERTLRRALRLDPHNLEALRMQCWLALDGGHTAHAVDIARQLTTRVASDHAVQAQAAMVFAKAGLLPEAQTWAERAVAQSPASAEAWLALSHVRLKQRRVEDAELAARQALQLEPGQANSLRHLGWVLMTAARYGEAQLAFLRAIECKPGDFLPRLELAESRRRAGHFAAGLQDANTMLAERPLWPPALLLKARLMVEGGMEGAFEACAELLRRDGRHADAAKVILRLAGLGNVRARRSLPLVPIEVLRGAWRDAVAGAMHTQSQPCFRLLASAACEDLEADDWMATAALYAASLSMQADAATLKRQARDWYRGLKLRSGLAPFPAHPIPVQQRVADHRPRIAYVVSQLHQSLLRRVLAAHSADEAQVFVYTNQPCADLPLHVHVQPLVPETLAGSCAANRIDVVIDTGGLHPFEGQFELLQAYARRLAPVQLGWLGCWGSAGGLFDGLLADEISIPQDKTGLYDEAVFRLEGGRWCWDPPPAAPEPRPVPALSHGYVTYGVCVRSLRLSEACLDAFARIVAATPASTIRFMGAVADDWPLRRDILSRMRSRGVDASRVFFDPFQPHAAYLAWFARIDVVLDALNGGGGLSLLDPLWMGVPVVTLAGEWAGARQGASILTALNFPQWVCDDEADFCALAVSLAGDRAALTVHRQSLRGRISQSPLVDGRRVAAQIEQICARLKADSAPIAEAPDGKARTKAHAQWALTNWLARPRSIELPVSATGAMPDLSVVIVLFNQAGLSLRTLQALADQRGVQFETIIIDNASGDNTTELLERTSGAKVIRNTDNAGFIRAARQGAALATGRYLVFLNSDAILQEGALATAQRAMQADPSIGVLGGRVVLTDGGLQEAGNVIFSNGFTVGIGRGEDPFCHAARARRTTDYVSGVFLVTPLALWRMLGGFDEAYAPAYYEDTDYCLRVWQAGLCVVYEPAVLLEHLEGGSAPGNSAQILMERNRDLFFNRHGDWLKHQPALAPQRLDGDRWLSPEDRPRRPRILVIDNEVPHMFKGGGLPRARLMLQALQDWPVTLFPLWTPHDDWRAVYASLPQSVEVAMGYGLAGLEDFLEGRQGVYDVLVVSRPPNLQALQPLRSRRPDLFAGMRLVYDAEALFALREIAMAGVQGRPLTRAAAHDRVSTEIALAADASDVLVVSGRDAKYFEAAGHRTHILSHGIAVRRNAPGLGNRRGLLFVGALHPDTPNEDGLLWFIDKVMPLLRLRMPTPPILSVVGVCTSHKIAATAGPDIRILGPQEVLEPHYDAARIFVAPVRFAGGVPAKVIEAVAGGVPTVASALLVRQLEWRDGVDILGAKDAQTFASAIARLLVDDQAWQRQQRAGWEQCVRRYDPVLFAQTLRRALMPPPGPGLQA
ncbi:tetratricopeptide repeat protein [Polaromonas sp. A23]|uniref:tetratricopeptide repeat protein n=1 Tax=Polaromonas sp. A23 TaxID=1944133 RepID=UPI000985B0AA|nr:tetratricopeptide repeat protein [Polaromonas sp. A23]OOG36665.1 glycosyl transferase [Polaromonas sp. A23]